MAPEIKPGVSQGFVPVPLVSWTPTWQTWRSLFLFDSLSLLGKLLNYYRWLILVLVLCPSNEMLSRTYMSRPWFVLVCSSSKRGAFLAVRLPSIAWEIFIQLVMRVFYQVVAEWKRNSVFMGCQGFRYHFIYHIDMHEISPDDDLAALLHHRRPRSGPDYPMAVMGTGPEARAHLRPKRGEEKLFFSFPFFLHCWK